jgi:hypothetical protein
MPGFGEDDAKLFARERGRLAASLAKAAALLPHGQPSSAAPPQSQLSPASQPHRQPLTYDRPSSATHPHGQPLSHGQPLPHGQPQPPMPLPAMPLSHSQPQPAVPFPTMPPRALIAMLHYPPLSKAGLDAGFLDIISEYRPAICIYGHLHGAHAELAFEGRIGATVYRMVSADHLGFRPLRLL